MSSFEISKFFKVKTGKDLLILTRQLQLAKQRYFPNFNGKVEVTTGLLEDDFVQNKITIRLRIFTETTDENQRKI